MIARNEKENVIIQPDDNNAVKTSIFGEPLLLL
jgi:hypothetical protein